MEDCQRLSQPSVRLGFLRALAGNLRDLSDGDVDIVAGQLPAGAGSAFRAAIAELKSHPGTITQPRIAAALQAAWQSGLQEKVQGELTRLSAP